MEWNLQLQIVGAVALAMLLGGLIGLERELADKPAGLRTHMLIAGAAALLTGGGDLMLRYFSSLPNSNALHADPLLIIQAIVTGISFLGAGTIIRREAGEQIEGLTTAASILFSAALGICVALRLLALAASATILALVVLRGVASIENWASRRRGNHNRKE
ncbi:MAG TPA: MgtC/SapB family protein [Blastocatellia bacterium]|nr:MgtC/SapB family protein [Blastocatellia bacterium]